jgi:hypothetical protein
MKKSSFILFLTLVSFTGINAQSVFGQYKSYHAYIDNAILDNKQYGIGTYPVRLHVGGGIGVGFSINDNFNLLGGLSYMHVKPNNTKSDYSFCEDKSCLPIAESNQIFLPIGIEYYKNTDRSPFQMFYTLKVVPAFSVTEVTEIVPYNVFREPQTSYKVTNNGFKFQDLQFRIALNNEFSINQKYKIYLEPSVSHSILFRTEDMINPDYIISLKVGFKIRKDL